MKLIDKGLRFTRQPRKRSSTNRIVIHHSAGSDVGVETIHSWHLDRGWFGIGYHYAIRYNGNIEKGRPEDTVGAHAGSSANGDSIGVCVLGNFEQDEPTEAQLKSLVWLINDHITPKYGELKIEGHSDHMATACPGRNFPWTELHKRLKEDKNVAEGLHWKQEQAIKMLTSLAEKGLLNSPEQHIEKVKDNEPLGDFLMLTLIDRLAKEI